MSVSSTGDKVFFAGGMTDDGLSGETYYSRVDIYDAESNKWSTAELSEPRAFIASSSIGNKILFAGGFRWENANVFSSKVDIYNISENNWSVASLSEARGTIAANQIDNKIYFSGGSNNTTSATIDIYDAATNLWTTSYMDEPKEYLGSVAVGNKLYWAGGIISVSPQTFSSQVEIRDIKTNTTVRACLSQAKDDFQAVVKGDDIIFFMGAPSVNLYDFDIYNIVTETWSIGQLTKSLNRAAIISVNSKVYVAGGALNPTGILSDEVSILEW